MTNGNGKNKVWLLGNRSSDDSTELEDKNITCADCDACFIFSIGEQVFYIQHRIRTIPQRCKSCRDRRLMEKISKGYPISKKRWAHHATRA